MNRSHLGHDRDGGLLRPANTQLCTLEAGHVIHQDNPTVFAAAVKSFLPSWPQTCVLR